MANCPKCNHKIPFLKSGFLSNIKNWLICPSCDSYRVANIWQMSWVAISFTGFGLAGVKWMSNQLTLGGWLWFLGVLFIVAMIFGAAYTQSVSIRLNLAERSPIEESTTRVTEPFTKPVPERGYCRIFEI